MLRTPWLVVVLALAGLALALTAPAADKPRPLSEDDVLKLVELRVEDKAVTGVLEKAGLGFTADAAALERLHKAGATPAVLAAVLRAADPKRTAAPPKALTAEDAVKLLQLGVEERDVLEHARRSSTKLVLDGEQTAALKKAGASGQLLTVLQGKFAEPDEEVVTRKGRYVFLKVVEPRVKLPELKEIFIVKAGTTLPIFESEILVRRDKYGEGFRLPAGESFDVYWRPTDGRTVRMAANFQPAEGTSEIRPEDFLARIRVTGKGLPPCKSIFVTAAGTTTPIFDSEIVQRVDGYNKELVVPAGGSYDVYLVPADGQKSELIEEKLEGKAGKVKVID